ncbi:branched-chain amino acid ABC transporter permease [Mesorhizobium sp. B1-1-9]|uniref:branched-chain amino acid ABC transporter permease n=1 Tax=Mesorhizobium sp. B1-1-9 TaxID=2589975 RepID=UPI00112D0584|nr:branched-chain amino acid ABC transporter permease [Mesorhizobium sp. B1-1-9]TPN58659.1 branched-chain amino acid ABC transporter permease [Mesorhizobium sp. B1-1-9]
MTAIASDFSSTPALPKWLAPVLLLAFAYGVVPLIGSSYLFEAILLPFLALSLAGVGLNILTGYAGQVSLGSAAFMAAGAFAAYNFNLRVEGLPLIGSIVLAGLVAAAIGIVFGLPSLRLKGFYLAVSTLAAQFFVQWALTKFSWFSNNSASGVIDAPRLLISGFALDGAVGRYLFALTIVTVLTFLAHRLVSSQTGRNFIAIRDNETAARIIGIPVLKTKLLAFAISSFIIGGLASIRGAFFGAALIVVFPLGLSRLGGFLLGDVFDSGVLDMSQRIVLGALIILFLILEPDGLVALWDRLRRRLLFAWQTS